MTSGFISMGLGENKDAEVIGEEGKKVVDVVEGAEKTSNTEKELSIEKEKGDKIRVSLQKDIEKSIAKWYETVPTRDNIPLEVWGKFLYETQDMNRTMGEIQFPNGVKIKTEDWSEYKKYIEVVIQEELSKRFIIARYVYEVKTPVTLTESFKIEGVKAVGTVTPAPKQVRYVYTGVDYGVLVDTEYFRCLQGVHQENELVGVEKNEGVGVVDPYFYVTTLKKLHIPIKEMQLSDLQLWQGIRYNVLTGEIVEESGDVGKKTWVDYNMNPETLYYVELTDTNAVVLAEYTECMQYGDWDLNTGHKLDFSEIFKNTTDKVKITYLLGDIPPEFEVYTEFLIEGRVQLGYGKRYPFLMYKSEKHLPYARLLRRLHSAEGAEVMTKSELRELSQDFKRDLKKQGRSLKELQYVSNSTRGLQMGVLLGIGGLSMYALLHVLSKRKQKKVDENAIFREELASEDITGKDMDNDEIF